MVVVTVINALVLGLILYKVKGLEKDVESLNTRVSAITKVLKGAYLRKSLKG